MGILLVIIFLGLSGWAVVALFRRLQRQHVSASWWVAFGILVACGATLGIRCAFYCEYHVGTNYRIASFPIPVDFFHLEDGAWVDFPVPEFQAWSAAFTNIITIIALATLPLWLASWWLHKRELADSQERSATGGRRITVRPPDHAMRKFVKATLFTGVPFGAAMGVFCILGAGWHKGFWLAVGSGLFFGIAMAAFMGCQRRQFASQSPAFSGEEVLHEGPANHFLNREGVGGWIYLTPRRFLFRSHAINLQRHELSIELTDISEAQPVMTAKIIPNGLRIVTRSGREERFVVEDRRRWCYEIANAQKTVA